MSAVAAKTSAGTALSDGAWLGPELWGNRLQDWVRANGRLECAAPESWRRTKTITWLTREIGNGPVHLRTRTGVLTAGTGFSGFIVGTGVPGEDWRRRTLVGSASGVGGGLMATYEADGQVRFRDHTSETEQFAFAELPSTVLASGPARTPGEDVTLDLKITPASRGTVQITLSATDTATGTLLSSARLEGVTATQVQGGVHLVGSGLTKASKALFWVTDPTGEGSGLVAHPERAFGPVVGTLFSVANRSDLAQTGPAYRPADGADGGGDPGRSTLKLSAQLMPVNTDAIPGATLQVAAGRNWKDVATEPVGPGYTVLFRVENWDTTKAQPYRVVTADGSTFEGTVPAEPTDGVSIAMINCTTASGRRLDVETERSEKLPGSVQLDLYSDLNTFFPHEQLATNVAAQNPDLVVALGDQLYQNSPTVADPDGNPELDWLYKYYMWLWAFRDITRKVPTITLIDDHDVYQGNIWGDGGRPAPEGDQNKGGYVKEATWVNTIQHAACGHDPDPYDPTPVDQGIEVYYCRFTYGGVCFTVVEDRKFKTGPETLGSDGRLVPEDEAQLLGERQEDFLAAWPEFAPDLPRVLFTQTCWACVQTNAEGRPNADQDSGGWPKPARDRALRLVKEAGALMLSGDQHLGSLIRQGIDTPTDGPIQLTSPAGSTEFQRWFEPPALPNASSTPFTGDFVDGFGNQFRALALVNPQFSQKEYKEYYSKGQGFGERARKNEGYCIVRVDPGREAVTLECWRWDNPVENGIQYPGFPQTFGFDEL